MGSHNNTQIVRAPEILDLDSRAAFRDAVMEAVEALGDDSGVLVIDFSSTSNLDTAGLATLAYVHRKASERRHVIRLRKASDEIRVSLVLARLEELFELEAA